MPAAARVAVDGTRGQSEQAAGTSARLFGWVDRKVVLARRDPLQMRSELLVSKDRPFRLTQDVRQALMLRPQHKRAVVTRSTSSYEPATPGSRSVIFIGADAMSRLSHAERLKPWQHFGNSRRPRYVRYVRKSARLGRSGRPRTHLRAGLPVQVRVQVTGWWFESSRPRAHRSRTHRRSGCGSRHKPPT